MASETGSAELPDIGTLAYNGVTFSQLYTSKISGEAVLDAAGRTVKYMKYTITVEGMITLDDDVFDATVDRIWMNLRRQLDAPAGILTYDGKGFGQPFIVNQPGGTLFDAQWGPIPKTLEFTPMGASRSAMIRWTVTTFIPELTQTRAGLPILQFNEDTQVVFQETGFSSVIINGTLEIALTRSTQDNRTLTHTVDNFRNILTRVPTTMDLTRFRVTHREIKISRDKRTMDWSFAFEELPYVGPPAGMLVARGSFNVSPEKASAAVGTSGGSVKWICNLKATYTVPNGKPRSVAMAAFANLWYYRMRQSQLAVFNVNNNGQAVQAAPGFDSDYLPLLGINNVQLPRPGQPYNNANQRATVTRFTVDEGLYLDSGEISFSASWWLLCNINLLLQATGVWRYSGIEGRNIWKTSVAAISGQNSWLTNTLDPAGDVIVDFGS